MENFTTPLSVELTEKEIKFLNAYIEAVYFTETGDTGQPDSDEELCEVFIRECTIDCLCFYSRVCCYLSDDVTAQAGHDFWLTRNGHGTGFWDRPEIYGTATNYLSETAESFQCVDATWENWVDQNEVR